MWKHCLLCYDQVECSYKEHSVYPVGWCVVQIFYIFAEFLSSSSFSCWEEGVEVPTIIVNLLISLFTSAFASCCLVHTHLGWLCLPCGLIPFELKPFLLQIIIVTLLLPLYYLFSVCCCSFQLSNFHLFYDFYHFAEIFPFFNLF